MLITDFDYYLPAELIAQVPLENRQNSKMLVVERQSQSFSDRQFYSFPEFLKKNDVLVLNNTRVFPARLYGKSETGAKVEVFLVENVRESVWETLSRPARRLPVGKKIYFNEKLSAEVLEKKENGSLLLNFTAKGDFHRILEEIGQTPLPPYIKRPQKETENDSERYQTVYAKERGAIAAPTAGLHFTPEILREIKEKGVRIVEITLHVGYGTFEPVRVADLSKHQVLPEKCEITAENAALLNQAKAEKSRIIAVGTTTTRALESFTSADGTILSGKKTADLTITPSYKFQTVSGLLTNFHLPQSSLLVLVSTFGGHQLIIKSYQHAVSERYRFYSYGDCMLII